MRGRWLAHVGATDETGAHDAVAPAAESFAALGELTVTQARTGDYISTLALLCGYEDGRGVGMAFAKASPTAKVRDALVARWGKAASLANLTVSTARKFHLAEPIAKAWELSVADVQALLEKSAGNKKVSSMLKQG